MFGGGGGVSLLDLRSKMASSWRRVLGGGLSAPTAEYVDARMQECLGKMPAANSNVDGRMPTKSDV